MTKKPKEFSFPLSFGGPFGNTDEWKDTWKKIAEETQKAMAHAMKEPTASHYPWLDKALFDPEEVMAVFAQTMQSMSYQVEKNKGTLDKNFIDVQAFLRATLDRFQNFPPPQKREKEAEWDEDPFFFLLQQSYLLNVQFFKEATNPIYGLDPLMGQKWSSYTRHLVDMLSSATVSSKSPESLRKNALTMAQGAQKARNDKRHNLKKPMKPFQLGDNLGLTPGKIVFQNDLFQLIQYEDLTKKVAKQPLLIVPPWTNKPYIFDLRPGNSFVQWALESGLTVFMISWVNPSREHAQKTLDDYVLHGVKIALDQVCQLTGTTQANTVAYCSGGVLLGCLLAYLKEKKISRIASATFIATPFDFSEVDEWGLYWPARQRHKLKKCVGKKEALEGQCHYIAQAFTLLRANDLIWSSDVNHYLLGQIPFPFDMLHWACDALRIPPKMHSAYLQKIFMENCFMGQGGLSIAGAPINLQNVDTPLFVMASYEDQAAPWRSVYALTQMVKSPSPKFVLSASGHLTGVFAHEKYPYWVADDLPKKADDWLKSARKRPGSWWDEWREWLGAFEGGKAPARTIAKDDILEAAPGSYAKSIAHTPDW